MAEVYLHLEASKYDAGKGLLVPDYSILENTAIINEIFKEVPGIGDTIILDQKDIGELISQIVSSEKLEQYRHCISIGLLDRKELEELIGILQFDIRNKYPISIYGKYCIEKIGMDYLEKRISIGWIDKVGELKVLKKLYIRNRFTRAYEIHLILGSGNLYED